MTLYLIAHVVRGKPAFDIAARLDCHVCHDFENVFGNMVPARGATEDCGFCDRQGYWWQIPTSGHRATPYWWILLLALPIYNDDLSCNVPPPPEGWPDHYSCNDRRGNSNLDEYGDVIPVTNQIAGKDLLAKLGLTKPREPIRRRM